VVSQDAADDTSSGDGAAPPPDRPSLWRNRDYLNWWTSETVSALGTSMSAIAFPLVVLYTTGSIAHAGLIAAAQMIGLLLTTLWGGALADRVSRKALMVAGPLAQAVAMAVAALLIHDHHYAVPLLAATAFAGGLAAGVAKGATTPALRRIVPKEQVGQATGQELGRDMAAELVGAPLGGVLFSIARWVPFALDAVSFVVAAVGAASIRTPLGPDRDGSEEKTRVIDDIREGLRFVRRQPFLRFTVIWASLLNALAQAFVLLFIALVRHRGGGPVAVGVVNSIALVGGVAGSVIGPILLAKVRATMVLRVGIWSFAAAFCVVAVVPAWWEIGVVLAFAMVAMVPLNVVIESYVVRVVPDALSGRVSAVNRFGAQGLAWVGPLLAGGLAAAFGPSGASLVLGALTVPLALALHLTRSLGVLDKPADEAEELTVAEPVLVG
jgi:MFS family permease